MRTLFSLNALRRLNLLLLAGLLGFSILLAPGCRKDGTIEPDPQQKGPGNVTPDTDPNPIIGMYLLNEGSMGANLCSLDYLDFRDGNKYSTDIFPIYNPDQPKELGDVGNDIKIYGGKIYAVINGSHKVVVLDARSRKQIAKIDLNNGRYLAFDAQYAYVSSFNSKGVDASQKGAVYRIDTASLAIDNTVEVGYQPEELVVADGKLYVANSGGYRYTFGDYDRTISVIDLATFKPSATITLEDGVNLHRLRKDRNGRLWLTSRGNYGDKPARIHLLEKSAGGEYKVTKSLDIACTNLAIHGDSLLFFQTQWNSEKKVMALADLGIISVSRQEKLPGTFLSDAVRQRLVSPYGITVHPRTGDIFITDARGFQSSGSLFWLAPDGSLRHEFTAGNGPAHMCFLYQSSRVQ